MTTPPEPDSRLDAALRRSMLGVTDSQVRAFALAGWTGTAMESVNRWAAWAAEHGTGVAQYGLEPGGSVARPVGMVQSVLATLRSSLFEVPGGRVDDVALPWITLVAGAPVGEYEDLDRMLRSSLVEDRRVCAAWLALGPIGPVAYAAGSDLADVQARAARGDLDSVALELLAGMRGYRFPDREPS